MLLRRATTSSFEVLVFIGEVTVFFFTLLAVAYLSWFGVISFRRWFFGEEDPFQLEAASDSTARSSSSKRFLPCPPVLEWVNNTPLAPRARIATGARAR